MLYVVGPNGGKRKKTETPPPSAQEFVGGIRELGKSMMAVVNDYNRSSGKKSSSKIEVLRVCLVSGGVFRHPSVSKAAVAEHLMCGLLESSTKASPMLDFAMDEGVFEAAWEQLTNPSKAPKPQQPIKSP